MDIVVGMVIVVRYPSLGFVRAGYFFPESDLFLADILVGFCFLMLQKFCLHQCCFSVLEGHKHNILNIAVSFI